MEEKIILLKAVERLNGLSRSVKDRELSGDALEVLLQNDLECGEIFAKWRAEKQLHQNGRNKPEGHKFLENHFNELFTDLFLDKSESVKPSVTKLVTAFTLVSFFICSVACADIQIASRGNINVKKPEIMEMPSSDPQIKKTFNRQTGVTTHSIRKPTPEKEKLKPICYMSNAMIKKLNELIKEKADDLYNRWIPPISFNIGTRFHTGFMDQDYLRDTVTAPGQKRDYPSIGASISIPIYNPDASASRNQGRAQFLSRNLGYLKDLEFQQKMLQSLAERRKLIRKQLDVEGFGFVREYYANEQKILETIANLNMIIRYFEQEFDIDMKQLKRKTEKDAGKQSE